MTAVVLKFPSKISAAPAAISAGEERFNELAERMRVALMGAEGQWIAPDEMRCVMVKALARLRAEKQN
ncbi:MAG: hypothetical protein ACOH1V_03125 [Stenotrophomonas sp.]